MLVLDDICATMHAQSEGADVKLLEVRHQWNSSVLISTVDVC